MTIAEVWNLAKAKYGNEAHNHFECKNRDWFYANNRIELGDLKDLNAAIEEWVEDYPSYVFPITDEFKSLLE